MALANDKLLNIARRLAQSCVSQSAAQAVALTGSVALGIADDISDIDLIVFYESIPPAANLNLIRTHMNGSPRIYSSARSDEARFKEGYFVEGVRCDLSHSTIAAFEEDMAAVLDRYSTDAFAQSRVSGIMESMPLHGGQIVVGFQDKAACYPAELARRMVETHLSFSPFWAMTDMGVKRGDLLYFYQTVVEAEKNIIGTLCGLNQVYLPGDFKHIARFATSLRFAPGNFALRLAAVLRLEPEAAADELRALIRDTFALVDQQMPEVDTSWPRQWFEFPRSEKSEAR